MPYAKVKATKKLLLLQAAHEAACLQSEAMLGRIFGRLLELTDDGGLPFEVEQIVRHMAAKKRADGQRAKAADFYYAELDKAKARAKKRGRK